MRRAGRVGLAVLDAFIFACGSALLLVLLRGLVHFLFGGV